METLGLGVGEVVAPAGECVGPGSDGGTRRQLDGNGDAHAHPVIGNDTLWRLRKGLQALLRQAQG